MPLPFYSGPELHAANRPGRGVAEICVFKTIPFAVRLTIKRRLACWGSLHNRPAEPLESRSAGVRLSNDHEPVSSPELRIVSRSNRERLARIELPIIVGVNIDGDPGHAVFVFLPLSIAVEILPLRAADVPVGLVAKIVVAEISSLEISIGHPASPSAPTRLEHFDYAIASGSRFANS
jgi:hypothetical protein